MEQSEHAELKKKLDEIAAELARVRLKLGAGHVGEHIHIDDSAEVAAEVSLRAPSRGTAIRVGKNSKVWRDAEWVGPVTVGDRVFINTHSFIRPNVKIGNDVSIGQHVKIISDTHDISNGARRTGTPRHPSITIGDGTWIGADSTILGGVNIGSRSIIAAGAVVTDSIPDNVLAGGVPARIIRRIVDRADGVELVRPPAPLMGKRRIVALDQEMQAPAEFEAPGPAVSADAPPTSAPGRVEPGDADGGLEHLRSYESISAYSPPLEFQQHDVRARITDTMSLQCRILRKPSTRLIVCFHGIGGSDQYGEPTYGRFEALAHLDASLMVFSDPLLGMDKRLKIGWHIGTRDYDNFSAVTDWIQRTASAYGVERIVLVGISSGGFAALQVGAKIPGCSVVAINPQTSVPNYKVNGMRGEQLWYLRYAFPSLIQHGISLEELPADWRQLGGLRVSVAENFHAETSCDIVYIQNTNDYHHYTEHFKPFESQLRDMGFSGLKAIEYAGPERHESPPANQILDWVRGALH